MEHLDNLLNLTESSHQLHLDILDNSERDLFVAINFVCACGVICIGGTIANSINLIVFFKQGFSNTVNISFFGLSVSDLCCVLTLLWQTICLNPLVLTAGAFWIPEDFVYLTAAWPHNISCRITSYITIFVTLERCLCIALPLKVKDIFSPTKTTIAVVLIFLLNIATLVPEYVTAYLDWTFFPESNRTLLALHFRPGREKVVGVVYMMNCATGMVSFAGIVVITVFLILKLREASKWRHEVTTGSHHHGKVSSRDKKTVKMVASIASILIGCYTPGISTVTFIVPEFDMGKRYINTFTSMWSISCVFQALNSSVNILLYYRMSSKYRETFHQLFDICIRRNETFNNVG